MSHWLLLHGPVVSQVTRLQKLAMHLWSASLRCLGIRLVVVAVLRHRLQLWLIGRLLIQLSLNQFPSPLRLRWVVWALLRCCCSAAGNKLV